MSPDGRSRSSQPPATDWRSCAARPAGGRQPRLPDVATTARHVEAEAPDGRVVIWPDVAHMIGMEVPDRLAETVVEFLAPIPRWG